MDAGLSIAASALEAATTEIAVTSQNIANAQTPGYVDEQAQLAAVPSSGPAGVGDGVTVTKIAQSSDALLATNNLAAQGSLANASSLQQVLSGIENIFPLGQSSAAASGSAGGSNTSLTGQLANFWSAWDGVAQDPSSSAPVTQVVDLARGLTSTLSQAATQLQQLATNTTGQITNQVAQVNQLLGQAASLNQQIVVTSGGGGSANQLVDQLNTVTSKLATLAGATVRTQQNGTEQISIGGVAVVQNDQASTLNLDTVTGKLTTANGTVQVPLTSGSLAGLLVGLNQSIPDYQNQLNTVASNLAYLTNNQLALGYTTSGAAGNPLFTITNGTTAPAPPPPATVTAANISVNPNVIADPTTLAVASTSSAQAAANDGSNAQKIAELANNTTVATATTPGSPDVAYQQLVQNIGTDVQNANSEVSAQTSVAQQSQQALQAATGVNTNTELTNLIQFQAAYQASAKLVSIINTTLQSLLSAV